MARNPDDLQLPQRRWTPEEFEAMFRAAILTEEERVELLEGLIVPMSPLGPLHIYLVDTLTRLLVKAAPETLTVSVQSTLACGESRPQPDLQVRRSTPGRLTRLPTTALLVIEVADTTLERDRAKTALYAGAAVPEVWIVDAQGKAVEVHTEPNRRAGKYRTIHILTEGDTLRTPALPRLRIPVSSLFAEHH
jgi:Uma2 family endonuclease